MARYIYQGTFVDLSGNVVSSGTITVYLAGTTTLASVYAASSGGTAVNSVTSDSTGKFVFYVDTGDYNANQKFDIVLSKAGFLSKTYSDITIFPENEYVYYANASATDQSVDANDNSIADLLAEIGTSDIRTIICKQGTYTFSTTVDWSAYINVTLKIQPGADFAVATGVTVALGCKVETGLQKWISLTGTGTVTFGSGSVKEVNPEWWGTDAAAMNSAIASITKGEIALYADTYTWTSTISVNKNDISIKGKGLYGTTIYFNPAANDILFDFANSNPALSINRCNLSNVILVYSGTHTNTAINIADASGFYFNNIRITAWTGTGILLMGRDSLSFVDMTIEATSPIKIQANPNYILFGADHVVFRDLYLLAWSSTTKLIEIDTGIAIQDVSFEGTQPWVLGKYGLYWVDGTSIASSLQLKLENIRYEQAQDPNGYFIYIDKTGGQGLQNLSINNCRTGTSGGIDPNGIYLRSVTSVEIRNSTIFFPATKVTLDINESVYPVTLQNVLIHPTQPVINIGTLVTKEFHLGYGYEIDYAKYVHPLSGGIQLLTVNSVTPNVAVGDIFYTANTVPTVYTDFLGEYIEKKIVIFIKDADTIIDFTGTNLKGNAGVDWSPASGDWVECVSDGTNWYCSVHDCTA